MREEQTPSYVAVAAALPVATGDWSADNRSGREHADELVKVMQEDEAPILLGRVVEDIMAIGRYGGVEVGFFQRVSELAMR